MQENKTKSQARIGIRSFITVVGILLAIIIFVGILTYVVPAGRFDVFPEGHPNAGGIDPDSFQYIESETRLPVLRWLTAPFEALVLGEGRALIWQVIAMLLILGGTFKVLELSGSLEALVRRIIGTLYKHRIAAVWGVVLVLMILSSVFGLQEQLLILYPMLATIAVKMHLSPFTAIGFILIPSGVGFTAAITNPFTIGTAALHAGMNVSDGIGYRILIFAVLYVVTSLFMMLVCHLDLKASGKAIDLSGLGEVSAEQKQLDSRKSRMVTALFAIALLAVIVSVCVPVLRPNSMILMGAAFIVGTLLIGGKLLGSMRALGKAFVRGVVDVAPSVIIVVLAFSIKYITDRGNILHTIFHYFYGEISGVSPYLAILLVYGFVLVVEFFIPSASAKAVLIIPLLVQIPIEGLSKTVILLAYLFAEGYTNVIYPTCGTLLIGLGLADVSYSEWIKKTALFQLLMMVLSLGFLFLAIFLGL